MAGGGTGGHVFPAINIADAIAAKWESEIIFFGTRRGIESVKAPQAGYEIKFIPVAGFQRRVTLKNLTFPFKLLKSMNICKKELSAFQPDIVIGTGGYVMGPALKSAVKLGIPTVIQEQNSFPGVTTRLLAKQADMIFLAYNEAKEYLKGADNILVTGNPVYFKPVNEKKSECRQMFKLNPELKTILVFGGSQGAASINKAIKEIVIDGKIHPSFQLLWQTGQKEYEIYKKLLEQENVKNVAMLPFIDQMPKAYKAADFAVCRAGAMTLSELMAAGLPAILAPYPYAAADHQFKNARTLADKEAAVVIKDDENLQGNLISAMNKFFNDENYLKHTAQNMRNLHKPNSVSMILEAIEKLLYGKYNKQYKKLSDEKSSIKTRGFTPDVENPEGLN